MKNTQKIVGIIHELTMGGAERMMVNILNHFASKEEDVHLVIFKNIGSLKALLNKNIMVHDLESNSVKKGMPQCLKVLFGLKPDTVFSGIGHVNIALAPFIPLMKKMLPQTKWIARETNIVSLQNQESKYPKIFDFLYRQTYGNFDVIIAQSEDMKSDLETNYPKSASKIVLINNPINIEKVQKLSEEEIAFPFDEKTINLITVGTLRQKKRHDLLLESFALLPQNYRLIVVGSGEEEKKLKALSLELKIENRVVLAGHQTNPYPYMKQADIFLLTSEHEGFPNVLLEANSVGTAIVSFACPGGIGEIIEEGINGFTVPNGDINALAKKLKEIEGIVLSNETIIDSVKSRFAQNIILKKYENIFYPKELDHE